jgi:hypothetical protein
MSIRVRFTSRSGTLILLILSLTFLTKSHGGTRSAMKWTIERFDSPQMFRVKVRGMFDADRFREMMDEVSVEKLGCLDFPVLFDDSDFNINNVGVDELVGAIDAFVRHNSKFNGTKVAIYMGARTDLEMVYRFRAVARDLSRVIIEIFRSEAEAVRWLTGYANGGSEMAAT